MGKITRARSRFEVRWEGARRCRMGVQGFKINLKMRASGILDDIEEGTHRGRCR